MSLGSRTATRRLAWRDMRAAPARTLITILLVTVATAAIGALTLITLGSTATAERGGIPDGAAASMFYAGHPMQQSSDGLTAHSYGGKAAPVSDGIAKVSGRFDIALSYLVSATVVPEGTDSESETERRAQASIEVNDWQRVGTLKPTDGREPRAPGEVVLTQAVLDRLRIGVGDRVVVVPLVSERSGPDIPKDALKPVALHVVGATTSASAAAPGTFPTIESGALAPAIEVTATLYGNDSVTWPQVQELNALGWRVYSVAVFADPPPKSEDPLSQASGAGEAGTVALLWVVGFLVLTLVFLLIVAPAFVVATRRNARTIALLSALGARRRDIRRTVTASGVLIGMVSGVLGFGLALLVWALLPTKQPVISLLMKPQTWLVALALIGFAAALGWVTTLWPGRMAARLDTISVLAGRLERRTKPVRLRWWHPVLIVGGAALAYWGDIRTSQLALTIGLLLFFVGLILSAGWALATAAKVAGRFGRAGAYPAREIPRTAMRSVPTVLSVAAVVGLLAATLTSLPTAANLAKYQSPNPATKESFIIGSTQNRDDVDPLLEEAALAEALADLEATYGPWQVVPVRGAPSYVIGRTPQVNRCPLTDADVSTPAYKNDERCSRPQATRVQVGISQGWGQATIIDDGSVVRALGLEAEPESTALQDALAAGGVGVEDPLDMHDGTAEIVSGNSENPDAEEAVRVPAARVDPYRLEAVGLPIISERLAKAFGITSHVIGYVVTPQHPITSADRTVIDAKLSAVSSNLHGAYAVPSELDARLPLYLILGGIILVAGVTILSVALSAAEMGQDFSVLRSLGMTRRDLIRIGGLRAGIQAFVGVILGLIAGVGGYALYFLFSRYGIPFDSFVGQNLFEQPFTPDYVSWAHRVIVPFGHLALLALGVIACAVIVGMILAPRSAQRPTATD